MAARANYRVKKWMADNAENDAIAQSKWDRIDRN